MVKTESFTDNAKKMGDEVKKLGRNIWLLGLGAVSLAEDSTRDAVNKLISRGESYETSDETVVGKAVHQATDRAKDLGTEVEKRVQGTVSNVLQRAGVPSRDEIRLLIDRVEELNRKVTKLQKAS